MTTLSEITVGGTAPLPQRVAQPAISRDGSAKSGNSATLDYPTPEIGTLRSFTYADLNGPSRGGGGP